MLTRFRPRLTFANVASILALSVALGGVAVASGGLTASNGQVHACVGKGGALSVVKSKCKHGRRSLALSGAVSHSVRKTSLRLHYTCISFGVPNSYLCTTPAVSGTAHCKKGERATGGGYGKPVDGSTVNLSESKPSPTSGSPTGWTVTGSGSTSASTPSHPDTTVPVYADCARP